MATDTQEQTNRIELIDDTEEQTNTIGSIETTVKRIPLIYAELHVSSLNEFNHHYSETFNYNPKNGEPQVWENKLFALYSEELQIMYLFSAYKSAEKPCKVLGENAEDLSLVLEYRNVPLGKHTMREMDENFFKHITDPHPELLKPGQKPYHERN